ncbi:hypothetical protein C799_01001 [Bacteroides thetaiotaomicron dnLKV9]|uniref:Glycosyl transferase family 1 domain-containing protein n=1 Tax=Bacteroides thetaiotaomicron dnLKV9 TaxID=1235785 RepID=R9HDA7_BACT4|nr:glycosyltransferase family 4 protein [Bacteroides thetaiotaomicron]EOS01894.1 hypothetical protein C799_01001 [Bacteroides thetaiotaomicron dnLKV9]
MIGKKKLCIVTTLSSSINNWIKPFLNEYHKRDIDVTIICNMDKNFEDNIKREYPFIHTFPIAFPRGVKLFGTIKSIYILAQYLRSEKFDMLQYSTPNASFYSAIASRLAGIKVRLYCQWGMVYVTKKGIGRFVCKCIEQITCKCSTQIQPDSEGNLNFCRANKLYDEKKSCIIWNGSAKGIDLSVYDISKKNEFAVEIKSRYGIIGGPILGFVGRLGREKGCNELFAAFRELKKEIPTLSLLFVGPIEKEDTIDIELFDYFKKCDSIIKTGRVSDVPKYMAAMDIFILPSYREGFGMSVVEASAMGIPVIATKYPGPSSAMRDGYTGIEIEVASTNAIIRSVYSLLKDPDLSKRMGQNGRRFAEENFEQKKFIQKYMDNRMKLLNLN